MKLNEIKQIINEQSCKDSLATLIQNDDFWNSDERVLVRAASYLQEKGFPEQSIELCNEIIKMRIDLSPKARLDLRYILGDCFYDLKKFEDGIRMYTEILRETESDIAFTNRGLGFWELGKYDDALFNYREAVKYNPTNYIALRGAGVSLMNLSEYQRAILYLEAAIRINPKYLAGHTALGAAYFKVDDFNATRRVLKKALKLDPTDQLALRGLEEVEKRLCKVNVANGGARDNS